VTVRQIALAAGVSPALVIHHYGSKEQLRAVLEERAAAFAAPMPAELAGVREEGASAGVAELFAGGIPLKPLIGRALRMGDELHSRRPRWPASFRRVHR
jgi:AcrR family transcriptional regulator